MVKPKVDEIAQVMMERPHVFLLGAGASLAALPEGDKRRKRLPLMDNFVDVVPVRDILRKAGIPFEGRNFEEVFGQLAADPSKTSFRTSLGLSPGTWCKSEDPCGGKNGGWRRAAGLDSEPLRTWLRPEAARP